MSPHDKRLVLEKLQEALETIEDIIEIIDYEEEDIDEDGA